MVFCSRPWSSTQNPNEGPPISCSTIDGVYQKGQREVALAHAQYILLNFQCKPVILMSWYIMRYNLFWIILRFVI